jgi:hypothetical protein
LGAEEHYLAGQGINAIVPVALAGDNKMDLVVANGGLTISNPLVLGGAAQTTATLAVNPVVNTGGITVLMNNISSLPVTATLTASPEPSNYGATFIITAVVTPVNGTYAPEGTVTFYIDGTAAACSSTGSGPTGSTDSLTTPAPTGSPAGSAVATCTITAGNTLTAGSHTLSAYYSGGAGANVPFPAIVSYSPLTFAGNHNILGGTTATYLYLCIGPAVGCPATGTPTVPSSPSLYPTSLKMIYGQIWNGAWTVTTSDGGAAPGDFQLYDLYNGTSTQLCDVPNAHTSICPASVGTSGIGTEVGVNVLTGKYVPGTADTVHSGSSAIPVTITVLQDPGTAVTVSGSPNPAVLGTAVTFTATVSGSYAAPTGTVSFNYGSQVLCSSQVLTPSTSGVTSTATCTTSSLPVGADQITASYAATTDFVAASGTMTETITPPATGNFNITVTPNPVSLGVGYGTQLNVTVTAQNGFAQDVNLSCGNLPNEAGCSFASSLISGGSGTTSVFLNTAAPHSCGTNEPYFVGSNGGGPGILLPALAGLIAIFLPGRRRWLRALLAVLLTAGATQITGCSTCSDLGTRPATYTFQVLGTAAGTGEVESQAVTLTITI